MLITDAILLTLVQRPIIGRSLMQICSADLPPGAWQQHPLSKALTAHSAAQIHLLTAVPRLLLEARRLKDEHVRNSFLRALKPFLSFALLDPDAKGLTPASLHAIVFLAR